METGDDDDNPRLKKLVLLLSIRNQITQNSISDKTLGQLEEIQQIQRDQGVAITDSMKRAYCSMILDCMVQGKLKGNLKTTKNINGCLDKSILRQLVCENLGMWLDDPVKARDCTLEAFTDYMSEAYRTGPSYLRGPEEQAPLTHLCSNANEPTTSLTEEDQGPIITSRGDSENVNKQPAAATPMAKDTPNAQETKESTVLEPCYSRNYSLLLKASKALQVFKAVITDHLPEAFRVSQPVATNNEEEASQSEGQHPLNSKHIADCINASGEKRQTQEGDPGKKPCSNLRNVPRPILMEQNVTSPTHQIIGMRRRRRRRYWTMEEEYALTKAVAKYGVGRWELILRSNPGVFKGRTGCNLKDKWRNLTPC